MAVGTLILALVTSLLVVLTWATIRKGDQKEERDRKERLLNEIIKWAIDVTNKRSESKKIFKEMAGITDTKQQEIFTHAHIVEVMESYVGMSGINRYIENITPESEQGLRDAVVKLIDDLETYIDFLDEWGRVKADAIAHNAIKEEEYIAREGEYTTRADEHVSQLEISAKKVIEEAVKIKTRDIS